MRASRRQSPDRGYNYELSSITCFKPTQWMKPKIKFTKNNNGKIYSYKNKWQPKLTKGPKLRLKIFRTLINYKYIIIPRRTLLQIRHASAWNNKFDKKATTRHRKLTLIEIIVMLHRTLEFVTVCRPYIYYTGAIYTCTSRGLATFRRSKPSRRCTRTDQQCIKA